MHHRRPGMTLLFVVSSVSATLVARDICFKWARLNATATPEMISYIQKGNVDAVRRALGRGANANSVTGDGTAEMARPGQSLLTLAVFEGYTPIVEVLIDFGGIVNSPDPDGKTPLVAAIHTHNVKLCERLLELGADPNLCGTNPSDTLLIETPMDAVVVEATTLKHTLFEPGVKSADTTDTSPNAINEVFAMYKLLRSRGVAPTFAQAQDIGDSNAITTFAAGNSARMRAGAADRASVGIDSQLHVE